MELCKQLLKFQDQYQGSYEEQQFTTRHNCSTIDQYLNFVCQNTFL